MSVNLDSAIGKNAVIANLSLEDGSKSAGNCHEKSGRLKRSLKVMERVLDPSNQRVDVLVSNFGTSCSLREKKIERPQLSQSEVVLSIESAKGTNNKDPNGDRAEVNSLQTPVSEQSCSSAADEKDNLDSSQSRKKRRQAAEAILTEPFEQPTAGSR